MINLSPQSPREKARSRQHPLALRRRASPFWLIALLALCLILAIVLALPQPMTMVAASIRSETIRIEILNPDASSTTLPRARHVETGTCFSDITVRPDFGAIVNYTRRIGSPLYISFTGGVSWHKENRLAGSSTHGAYFKLDPDDKDCLTEGNVRLPVNGMMMAGMDTSGNDGTEPSLPLLSGELKVYGRAVDKLLGLLPLKSFGRLLPLEPYRLYLSESLTLPPGSRLGRAFTDQPENDAGLARWSGFADANMTEAGKSDRGLIIEASANASAVEVVAPAPGILTGLTDSSDGSATTHVDVVSLTLAAQLTGDPNLRWLLAILTFILAILTALAQFFSLPPQENGK
jgi:hypothetical protein